MLSNPLVMKEVGSLITSKTKCDLEPMNHKVNPVDACAVVNV